MCDLHARVPVAAKLLSYHLRVLHEAGLVTATRQGRWIDYRLNRRGFAALWAQATAAGIPLPGTRLAAGRCGPRCENPQEPQSPAPRRGGPAACEMPGARSPRSRPGSVRVAGAGRTRQVPGEW